MKKMAAAKFKAECLAVMDRVSRGGGSVVVTKHGKPIVKMVAIRPDGEDFFGALAGTAKITGDIMDTAPAREWGVE